MNIVDPRKMPVANNAAECDFCKLVILLELEMLADTEPLWVPSALFLRDTGILRIITKQCPRCTVLSF